MRRLLIPLLFTIVCLTWGTTWLAMKLAGETVPPVFATGLRLLCAAPFLLLIAWLTRAPLLFPRGQRAFQLEICLCYFAIPFSLMIYGETWVSSGLASVIFANMPVAILLASLVILQEKTTLRQVGGLIIATVSLSAILIQESRSNTTSQWQGIVALVIALIMHALVYTRSKKRSCHVSVITFNALPCLGAGVLLVIAGALLEKPHIATFAPRSLWAIFYLGAFAGVCGILLYFQLQKHATAFQASTVFLIFPLIALTLENHIYGKTLSVLSLVLMAPLAVGIALILLGQRQPPNTPTAAKKTLTSA